METKPELNNVVIEGNNLPEPPKKIKKTKTSISIHLIWNKKNAERNMDLN